MGYLAVLLFILVLSDYPAFLGSEYDEEEVDYEESDSDESWTTESAISSEAILSSMCMNGGDEKPFACPVPGCKKRYKVSSSALVHLISCWCRWWGKPLKSVCTLLI